MNEESAFSDSCGHILYFRICIYDAVRLGVCEGKEIEKNIVILLKVAKRLWLNKSLYKYITI